MKVNILLILSLIVINEVASKAINDLDLKNIASNNTNKRSEPKLESNIVEINKYIVELIDTIVKFILNEYSSGEDKINPLLKMAALAVQGIERNNAIHLAFDTVPQGEKFAADVVIQAKNDLKNVLSDCESAAQAVVSKAEANIVNAYKRDDSNYNEEVKQYINEAKISMLGIYFNAFLKAIIILKKADVKATGKLNNLLADIQNLLETVYNEVNNIKNYHGERIENAITDGVTKAKNKIKSASIKLE